MMQDERGHERGWYTFPQYLWRLRYAPYGTPRFGQVAVYIRRGNTPEEAADKGVVKDLPELEQIIGKPMLVGVLDTCDIDDARRYNTNHRWDWLNE